MVDPTTSQPPVDDDTPSSRALDAELRCMANMLKLVETQDPEAQQRILSWLTRRVASKMTHTSLGQAMTS